MFVAEAVEWGKNKLLQAGIENAQMEACWLIAAQIGALKNSLEPLVMKKEPLFQSHLQAYRNKIVRRSKNFPLAYILGSQEFFGIEFFVNAQVLIPRQETEILVEQTLKKISKLKFPSVLEIGTGSGNIAVALAKNSPNAKIVAMDISPGALAVAKKNARRNGVDSRIIFRESDLFSDFSAANSFPAVFDCILSNPPYLKKKEFERLQKEIQFEPRIALDGGADGLEIIESLIRQSRQHLKPNGFLALEVGYQQSKKVKRLMELEGFSKIEMVKDCSGIERVVIGEKYG